MGYNAGNTMIGQERAVTATMQFWRELNVSLLGMKFASLMGLTAMMLPTEPQFWVACATGFTVAGSIGLQILKNRQDDKRYERDRQERLDHQAELKHEVAKVAEVAATAASDLKADIATNTQLTSEVGAKADQAYNAANHVNDKIAAMARGPLPALAIDTNEAVHRIEDKIEAP